MAANGHSSICTQWSIQNAGAAHLNGIHAHRSLAVQLLKRGWVGYQFKRVFDAFSVRLEAWREGGDLSGNLLYAVTKAAGLIDVKQGVGFEVTGNLDPLTSHHLDGDQ